MSSIMTTPKHLKALTSGQVSRLCSVAPRTVSKWIDTGAMVGYRLPDTDSGKRRGMDRRVTPAELIRFMRSRNMPAEMIDRAEKFIGGGFRLVTLGFPPSLVRRCDEIDPKAKHAHTEWELGYLMGTVSVSRVAVDVGMTGTDAACRTAKAIRSLPRFDGVGVDAVIDVETDSESLKPFNRVFTPSEWLGFLTAELGGEVEETPPRKTRE